jgi:ABC-type glutathione transport system ATPase component
MLALSPPHCSHEPSTASTGKAKASASKAKSKEGRPDKRRARVVSIVLDCRSAKQPAYNLNHVFRTAPTGHPIPWQHHARRAGCELEACEAGDIGVLIGPSGCGKTTLLRAVAGLEPVIGGANLAVRPGGQRQGHTEPAERRRIGMVFQDYALFPHMDVGRNVGFGLAHLPKAERQQRVAEVLNFGGPDRL